jgi:hypothetical protein
MVAPAQDELQHFIDEILGEKARIWERFEERIRRRRRHLGVLLAGVGGLAATVSVVVLERPTAAITLLATAGALYCVHLLREARKKRPFEYENDFVAPLVHYVYPRLAYRSDGLSDAPDESALLPATARPEGAPAVVGKSPTHTWLILWLEEASELYLRVEGVAEFRADASVLREAIDAPEELQLRVEGARIEALLSMAANPFARDEARRLDDLERLKELGRALSLFLMVVERGQMADR